MNDSDQKVHPFISYLISLSESEDRGALAELRRGLGKTPGTVPEMYRYVVPWISADTSRKQEFTYFLIAALFAYHPKHTNKGNMGDHLALTRESYSSDDALDHRFTHLLASHPDDLPTYLQQAIGLLKSKGEIAINWNQLLKDLRYWDHPDKFAQKQWARSFWGCRKMASEKS